MKNSKNDLFELFKELGFLEDVVHFSNSHQKDQNVFVSTVRVELKGKGIIEARGFDRTVKNAEKDASKYLLELIHQNHRELLIDWDEVKKEAQLGDVLIKLYAYLSDDTETAAAKSMWLQKNETDKNLADIFDTLQAQNHASVSLFGNNLGAKRKATWIEALIWRMYGDKILSPTANQEFVKLADFLRQS